MLSLWAPLSISDCSSEAVPSLRRAARRSASRAARSFSGMPRSPVTTVPGAAARLQMQECRLGIVDGGQVGEVGRVGGAGEVVVVAEEHAARAEQGALAGDEILDRSLDRLAVDVAASGCREDGDIHRGVRVEPGEVAHAVLKQDVPVRRLDQVVERAADVVAVGAAVDQRLQLRGGPVAASRGAPFGQSGRPLVLGDAEVARDDGAGRGGAAPDAGVQARDRGRGSGR